ncbi:MAG: hypothetical protein QNK37_28000 [Acidobacteriota bacterium]|nr:hypothetical protein [Acidobacteriota bacterium]
MGIDVHDGPWSDSIFLKSLACFCRPSYGNPGNVQDVVKVEEFAVCQLSIRQRVDPRSTNQGKPAHKTAKRHLEVREKDDCSIDVENVVAARGGSVFRVNRLCPSSGSPFFKSAMNVPSAVMDIFILQQARLARLVAFVSELTVV